MIESIPFLASGVAFALGFGELFVRERTAKSWLYAGLQISLGLLLLHAHLLFHGGIEKHLWFFRTHSIAVYAVGPLLYLFFQMAVKERERPQKREWLHFVPAVIVLLLLLPLFFQAEEEKLRAVQVVRLRATDRLDYGIFLFLAGLLHCACYIALAVAGILRRTSPRRWWEDRAVRILLLLSLLGLVIALVTVLSALRFRYLTDPVLVSLSVVVVLMHVLGRRYPHLFFDLVFAVHAEKYRTSLLKNLDLDAVQGRLVEAMESQHIYREEDLTLQGLADRVGITPHQLSEYFNSRLGVNFNGFVNGYRVKEARRLLLEDPDRTVLSVAYAVGFNSKSSFNTAFARQVGVTPTDFRAKERSKS